MNPPLVLGTDARTGAPYTLPPAAAGFHTAIFGSTGTGKSYLAHAVAVQHIVNRGGCVGVIDPHADLSLGVLDYLVSQGFFQRYPDAFERVVYVDFSEDAFLPLNVLSQPHLSPHATAEMVLEALSRTFPDLQGGAPLLRTLFLCGVLTLTANGLPLTCLYPLLLDREFRTRCLRRVSDPLVHQTFAHFDGSRGATSAQAGSTLRRAFLMTFSPTARFTLGQPENVLDLRAIMDSGRTLLLNLGSIPDVRTRRLIGALVMTLLEQAALSRAQVPASQRRPWTAIVDEWPVICARQPETLASILDTSRKYGLTLWLLGQHAGQIGAARLSGALENCRLVALFRLGPESAAALAPHVEQINPYLVKHPARTSAQRDIYLSAGDQRDLWRRRLQELPARRAIVRAHGSAPRDIRTLTVEASASGPGELEEVVAEYRRRYQRSREAAEAATMQVLTREGIGLGILNHEPYAPDIDHTDTIDDFDFDEALADAPAPFGD